MSAAENKLSLAISSPKDGGESVEFQMEPLHTPSSPTVQYFRSIFDRADRDHNGYITVQELQEMIEEANNPETGCLGCDQADEPIIPPQIVRRIHKLKDTDHDGQLNYEEFVNMLKDPKLSPIFGRYINKYVQYVIPRKKLGSTFVDQFDGDELYEDEYTCCPPKLGMIIISVIELVFFLIDELTVKNSTNDATGPMAQLFIYDPAMRYKFWRYFTYMFVHIGYLHLVVNLVVQIFIGIPLEMVHGWWRVLLIYLSGVVAGSLGTSITDPNSKLAGASGGVYSLITAHIATIIMNWGQMSFPAVQLIIFLIITVMDVGTSIHKKYWGNNNEDDHVGYVAHLAGAIAGLLVGIVILRNLKLTKKENVIWWIAIALYVVLMLVAIGFNIFKTDYFPQQI